MTPEEFAAYRAWSARPLSATFLYALEAALADVERLVFRPMGWPTVVDSSPPATYREDLERRERATLRARAMGLHVFRQQQRTR